MRTSHISTLFLCAAMCNGVRPLMLVAFTALGHCWSNHCTRSIKKEEKIRKFGLLFIVKISPIFGGERNGILGIFEPLETASCPQQIHGRNEYQALFIEGICLKDNVK